MQDTNNKKGLFLTIAVLLISLINIETSLVNSALGDIVKAFPGIDTTLISLIATLPTLIMIPMTILSGKLCYYYSKKHILILGLTLYVLGGVGGTFVSNSIYQVLVMRTVLGLGAGLAAPLGNAIIADLFEEAQRAKMIGWSNAFGSVVAFIMTWIAGALCVINWKYTFLAYLVFAVILLIEIIALPTFAPEKTYKVEETKNVEKEKVGSSVLILAGSVLITLLIGSILMIKLAIFIMDSGIGNSFTTATAFNCYSAGTIGVGLIFMPIYKKLKRFVAPVSYIFMISAFVLIMNAYSAPQIYLGMFLNGFGGGMFIPYIFTKATLVGSKVSKSFVIGLVMQAMFLGQFLGTFVEPVLKSIFGNMTIKFLYTFGAGAYLVCAVVSFLWVIMKKEKQSVDVNDSAQIG